MTARALFCAAIFFAACGNSGAGDDAGVPDLGPDAGAFPPAPALGQQIDRMGRAAIDTIVVDPFYLGEDAAAQAANQAAYRAAVDPMNWVAQFAGGFEVGLAQYDGFDGVCGDALWSAGGDGDAGANRYAPLANALADDQLYVDLSRSDCSVATNYLSVEMRAIGLSASPAGCGGRTPLDDVIDASYTAFVDGDDVATNGPVGDGIAADGDGAASLEQFPFLTAPN